MRHGWTRRLAGLAAVTAMAGTMTALAASPATAALPGLQTVSATVTHTGAGTSEIALVTCPAGVVIGTGWSIWSAGADEVSIQKVYPTTTSVVAVANEDETGAAGDWKLTVYATCATQPAGYEIVTATSTDDSVSPKSAIANCSTIAKKAYGTGFVLDGTPDETVLTGLNPGTGAVQATAYEDDTGAGSDWSITAYAVCADDLPGRTIVASSDQTAYPRTVEVSVCPTGKVATGVGAYFTLGTGNVGLETLKAARYASDHFGTATGREDEDGTAALWDLTTEVVCVTA